MFTDTRNDRFNKSFRSLEKSANGRDLSKWRLLSDQGIGVERMLNALDGEPEPRRQSGPTRFELLRRAILRLGNSGKAYLIPTLLLIVKNGAHREESIAIMPKATYYLHREELTKFFVGL